METLVKVKIDKKLDKLPSTTLFKKKVETANSVLSRLNLTSQNLHELKSKA
ncbi:hypothetical protein [Haemophilus sp. oral taxon 851]|uniref:hypothetical protein n=1 Tax=Haemophilus sp. oral taxon 851 TaxID=762964 RepID=UPI0002461B58|nr:hypothetical protein [Haemophilus sp. oral taxon 851]EHO47711.1 hypothetical protein HMPREF9096_01111 [Haemophilus sp. oral taxon 851 str. F0397]